MSTIAIWHMQYAMVQVSMVVLNLPPCIIFKAFIKYKIFSNITEQNQTHRGCYKFLSFGYITSQAELKKLNYFRVYLGVTTLSDIMLADGTTLDPHMRPGNLSLYSSSSKQLKAKQT
eukprot:15351567-Ditylum_brightwellii.AAC.1